MLLGMSRSQENVTGSICYNLYSIIIVQQESETKIFKNINIYKKR